MKIQIFVALTCLLLMGGLFACNGTETAQANISPEQLGVIGAEVYVSPARANQIFKKHGITEKQFNHELDRVTADPDLASRYSASFEFEANVRTG